MRERPHHTTYRAVVPPCGVSKKREQRITARLPGLAAAQKMGARGQQLQLEQHAVSVRDDRLESPQRCQARFDNLRTI
jgi:hypothetical protein